VADSTDIVFDRQAYIEMAKAWTATVELEHAGDPEADKANGDHASSAGALSRQSAAEAGPGPCSQHPYQHPYETRLASTAESEALSLFQSCDKNADGQLSHKEVRRYLHDAPWALSYLTREDSALDWASLWRDYGTNAEGGVDQPEFLRLYMQRLHPLIRAHREAHSSHVPTPAAKGKLAGAEAAVNGLSGNDVGEAAMEASRRAGEEDKDKVAEISGQAAGAAVVHTGGSKEEAIAAAVCIVLASGGSREAVSRARASISEYHGTVEALRRIKPHLWREEVPPVGPPPYDHAYRLRCLREAFGAFDLDCSGEIGVEEIYRLGVARRVLRQASGEWSRGENERFVQKMKRDHTQPASPVREDEFVSFHDDKMPSDQPGFDQAVADYIAVAAYLHLNASKQRKENDDAAAVRVEQGQAMACTPSGNADLRVLFSFMDKNGDGKVSRIEMIQALRKDPNAARYLGLPSKFKQGTPEHTEFERVFQRLDADGSKEISWEEFERICQVDTAVLSDEGRLAITGGGALEDGVAYLTHEDWHDQWDSIELFLACDLNADGKLSHQEIKIYLEKAP